MRHAPPRLLLTLLLTLTATALSAQTHLTTVAERSGFVQTGRYDEVIALCHDYARHYPEAARCSSFGTTPEGRPMQLLVASRSGALTADEAKARQLPVVLVQGGIHAGEIDGKDAGFLALREILDGTTAPGILDGLVVLFVPVFNVDGHERFGRWNRPNQRGPEKMGWRTTAQNHNLNRDYLKADSPEMRAMLALLDAWDPILAIDLHATNGAKFQHDVSIQVEPLHSGDRELRKNGRDLRDGVIGDLAAHGSLPLPFYPSFVEHDNPASGFADGVAPPRFSHGYFPLRNRFGMLVETHSWKEYPVRVRITRNTIVSALEHAAEHGQDWLLEAKDADKRATRLAGKPLPLDYKASDAARSIDFKGYAYARTRSEVSGALMTRYDEDAPLVWRIPLRDEVEPDTVVTAPKGGYLVPTMHAERVGGILRLHGVEFRTLDQPLERARLQTFRADKVEFTDGSMESHQRLTLEGRWKPERRSLAAGALFVPIAQPKARLVVALLEPLAPDSLAAWGHFNNHFERKEYMEAYVAEEVAREMLADDSRLRKEFERRLRDDPEFAASPQARLDFFYRRHDSWDEQYSLYPVFRTSSRPR